MASFSKRGDYWRAQVRAKGQETISRTFDTKAQAQIWARSIENEMDRGVYIDRSEAERTTLLEAIERYEKETIARKGYPGQELQRTKHWKAQPLAKRYLATLRGVDFAKYRDSRMDGGRAAATVRQELQVVSHLFETARKEWGMEGLLNPLKNISKPHANNERERRLEPGEFELLSAELGRRGNPYALPAFELAIETSLRQGMLMELRWEWVDLNGRAINIPIEYRRKANKGVPAAVPLSTRAISVLRAMPRAINGKVFDTTPGAIVMIWKKSRLALGIKDLRWHDLRREAVSRFAERGLHPLQIAAVSGHKNLNVLFRRYTKLKVEDLAVMLG
jgi:integrase